MGAAGILAAVLAAASVAVLLAPADAGRLSVLTQHRPAGGAHGGGGRARQSPGSARSGGAARATASMPGGPTVASGPGQRGPEQASSSGAGRSTTGARSLPSAPVLACLLAAAALALSVQAPTGLVLGAVTAVVGPRLLRRLEPQSVRVQREQLLGDLPLVLDLLAACLAGGAALPAAAEAVGHAVGGPAGDRLRGVSAALRVGAPPGEAWRLLAGSDPDQRTTDPLGPAARTLSRAADGGAPVAATVSRLAADARAEARGRAEQAARRVGVLAVAPLGLCFLPAFVLLGVVPLVAALAGPLLASF